MTIVIAAIIKKENKFLIAKRSYLKQLAGYWEFPGGKLENGETEKACLQREIKEELNIEITVGEFFMENIHHYGDKTILLKAFLCEYISGEILLNDHDEILWVTKDELNNYKFAAADIPFIIALNDKQ